MTPDFCNQNQIENFGKLSVKNEYFLDKSLQPKFYKF